MKPLDQVTRVMKSSKEELVRYEMPLIAEFISIGFLQELIARYTAYKVNKKYARYIRRLKLQERFGNL